MTIFHIKDYNKGRSIGSNDFLLLAIVDMDKNVFY